MTVLDGGIRVTCEDLVTGEKEEQVIYNDYCLVTAGLCYLHHIQTYSNGTTILTMKKRPLEDGEVEVPARAKEE